MRLRGIQLGYMLFSDISGAESLGSKNFFFESLKFLVNYSSHIFEVQTILH